MPTLQQIREQRGGVDIDVEQDHSAALEDDGYEDDSPASVQKSNGSTPPFAGNASRAVAILRFSTLSALLAAAVVTALMIWGFAYDQEIEDFEQSFKFDASKMLDTYKANANLRLDALGSFSVSMTQYALTRKMQLSTTTTTTITNSSSNGQEQPPPEDDEDVLSFPFVTVPDFERRAAYTLESAEVLGLTYWPKVEARQRRAWEKYAVANQDWIVDSLAFQQAAGGQNNPTNANNIQFSFLGGGNVGETSNITVDPISPFIYYFDDEGEPALVEIEDQEFSFPLWQVAPAHERVEPINYDVYVNFATEMNTIMATHLPLLTEAIVLEPRNTSTSTTEEDRFHPDNFDFRDPKVAYRFVLDQFLSKLDGNSADASSQGGPVSFFNIPVFDAWNIERRSVAGVLLVMLYWQRYLDFLLPVESTSHPMMAVLDGTCGGQQFSFEIQGPVANYLGEGDLHDTKYDYLMMESGYDAVLGYNLTDPQPGQCAYNLRVYPTSAMENSFTTYEPTLYAVLILSVFLFVSCVFMCYDFLSQRRHRIVNNKAVEQSAVVSSLFPEEVRQQVVGIVEKNNGGFSDRKTGQETWKDRSPSHAEQDNYERLAAELDNSAPVANLYPNCTVLFADIAGFTQWSSNRSPSEVFKLLEAMYGVFDRIAKKKGVFKVETIGDCYVAVTGLPKPQEQHAVIMAKFATDCMTALSGMMHVLVDKLGPDTASLTMRVGLHSGPVTAGVLRGDRARFQLFGDTVNTAARMESNGQKGRIQVSQSTANLLIAAGKQHWVRQREDKIQAKGKGELTTYWVEISSITTSSATSGSATNPMTASVNSPMTDGTTDMPAVEAREVARLSHQQHQEYKEILEQLKGDD